MNTEMQQYTERLNEIPGKLMFYAADDFGPLGGLYHDESLVIDGSGRVPPIAEKIKVPNERKKGDKVFIVWGPDGGSLRGLSKEEAEKEALELNTTEHGLAGYGTWRVCWMALMD